ncbi:MAG TPA: DUF1786 family protein [Dehalococcoidia bacterium]|nr:DUF1786 family protein [Dehalococcoidia bacterium]
MKILAIDVGTGTQDIFLFDSDQEIENCIKMVMPSPTQVMAGQVRAATRRGESILITGVTMGGGPSHWAVMDHLRAGYYVCATPRAAQTFDDDLEGVRRMGIEVVGDDEAATLRVDRRIEFKDLYLEQVTGAIAAFGGDPEFDLLAVAVFDHGAAPPGYSDRIFRFDYIRDRVRENGGRIRPTFASFAFPAGEVPPSMTRLQAVADSYRGDKPVFVMDTGPAAVLGALEDSRVAGPRTALIVNVGNFHTLAFHLDGDRIAGLFEHHTGELSQAELIDYLAKLADGRLTNQEIYDDSGHGAFLADGSRSRPEITAVTGPRRALLADSAVQPYFAVPHGDMMIAGCFGLLRAVADRCPDLAEPITTRLDETQRRKGHRGDTRGQE